MSFNSVISICLHKLGIMVTKLHRVISCRQEERLNHTLTAIQVNEQNNTKQIIQNIIQMPKKYLCPANDKSYRSNIHEAYFTHNILNDSSKTDSLISRYDSDEMDMCWLDRVNFEFE